MRVGYGRGYYGEGQLAQCPPRRGSGWAKFAVVLGAGAVVWLMWPRSPKPGYAFGFGGDEPKPPAPPPPPGGQTAQIEVLASSEPLDQVAQSRGYPSQKTYEDAVVESARQLQDAGAKVAFSPHLQHLAPRLLP